MDKFVDVDDLVGEEDVAEVKVEANDDAEKKMDASDLTQLSARERNRLKRKAKRGARDAADGVEPVAKRGRKPGSTGASGKNAVDPETAARLAAEAAEEEDEAAEVEAGGWPLARTCEKLAYSLFAPRWEERHGAAAALREVLRTHAASAAVPSPPPRARGVEPDAAARAARKNASWLEDAAVRLLCVLSLDRFGDYVGDGVVAPVRETGAQALGAGLLLSRRAPSRRSSRVSWCCSGARSGRCATARSWRCGTCSPRATRWRRGCSRRRCPRRRRRSTTKTTTCAAPPPRRCFRRRGTYRRTATSRLYWLVSGPCSAGSMTRTS